MTDYQKDAELNDNNNNDSISDSPFENQNT